MPPKAKSGIPIASECFPAPWSALSSSYHTTGDPEPYLLLQATNLPHRAGTTFLILTLGFSNALHLTVPQSSITSPLTSQTANKQEQPRQEPTEKQGTDGGCRGRDEAGRAARHKAPVFTQAVTGIPIGIGVCWGLGCSTLPAQLHAGVLAALV